MTVLLISHIVKPTATSNCSLENKFEPFHNGGLTALAAGSLVNKNTVLREKKIDKKVTISDVAVLAGVSVGTVSNVMNGRGNVTAQRRQKVLDAISALSFTGSLLAKGMRSQRYPLVGLCLPNTTSSNFVFMSDMMEEYAAGNNFEMVQLITRHDPARELARIQRLIASKASGVLLLPTTNADLVLGHLRQAEMPTVIINRFVENEDNFDQVLVDHRGAFYKATRQLLEWGHRKVIVATQFPNFSVVQQNISGIAQAIEDYGQEVALSVMRCKGTKENFRYMLADEMRVSAEKSVLVASSSLLAAWSIEAFQELGLRCPDDLSLLCAEEPDWALAARPGLSCIEQPTRELARISWDLLDRRINGGVDDAVTIRCDARINFRQSVMR